MNKGEVPCSAGIDTDARWWCGYSHTKKGWMDIWIQTTSNMYSSRRSYSTSITAAVDVTTANIQRIINVCFFLTSLSSSVFSFHLPCIWLLIRDMIIRNYMMSKKTLGIDLVVCPLLKDTTKVLTKKRLEMVCMLLSISIGAVHIYSQRRISIEPR